MKNFKSILERLIARIYKKMMGNLTHYFVFMSGRKHKDRYVYLVFKLNNAEIMRINVTHKVQMFLNK